MKYFTKSNFSAYTQKQLNNFNNRFEGYAKKKGFDLKNKQGLQIAKGDFWNEIMIPECFGLA